MRYDDFVGLVEARAAGGLDEDRATGATRAVLGVLADCLTSDLRLSVAAQLPKELQPSLLGRPRRRAPRRLGEFLDRVADREELTRSEAFDHTRAVLSALAVAISPSLMDRISARMTPAFDELFGAPAVANWPQGRAGHLHV